MCPFAGSAGVGRLRSGFGFGSCDVGLSAQPRAACLVLADFPMHVVLYWWFEGASNEQAWQMYGTHVGSAAGGCSRIGSGVGADLGLRG